MRRATRRQKRQRGGEYICPPGMPAKICESRKRKHNLPKISSNLKNSIKAAVKLRNWRMLPEDERIARQKAYWNTYATSRNVIRSNSANNENNNNYSTANVHEFTNENL